MAKDFVPRADGTFDEWQAQLAAYASAHAAQLGLSGGDVLALSEVRAGWESAFPAHVSAAAAARAARAAKDGARGLYERRLREIARRLQASADVDASELAALGLTVPDGTRTPVARPAREPLIRTDTSRRLLIGITCLSSTGDGAPVRGKPEGVRACELFVTLEDEPLPELSDWRYLGSPGRFPFWAAFSAADVGKMAKFVGRWVSTRGEPGPQSRIARATVTG